MKSRTSFFNSTVLKKDITRFAPVWGLYTIFLFMAFFLFWEVEIDAARFANSACYIMQAMGVINFAYAGICALLLFGDLFNTKLCNALHAFPLRRESWFLTHCTAGVLFSLIPNALATVLAGLLLQEYFYLALMWLGLMCLQFLFFFGAGAFSAMCAGNRLGAAAVYGIFNFLAVIGVWLVVTFYEPFLYGIILDTELYVQYSPVVGFTNFEYISTQYDKMTAATTLVSVYGNQWRYAGISAGVGLVLLAVSILLYRKRQLENAGNFISFRPVAPVFLVIYTLCAGAVMYYAADLFAEEVRYVFLILGFAIGFFTGLMLLHRRVNVFQGKRLLGFAILLAIFGASVGLTWLDPAGITRYVPEIETVQKVQIRPNAATYYGEKGDYALTDKADIQAIIDVHNQLLSQRTDEGDMWLTLTYTLENGVTVQRQYQLHAHSDAAKVLKGYYSSWDYLVGGRDIDTLAKELCLAEFQSNDADAPYIVLSRDAETQEELQDKYSFWEGGYVAFSGESFDEATLKGLLQAVKADCDAGNMAQVWAYHEDHTPLGWLLIQFEQKTIPTDQDILLETGSAYISSITYAYDMTATLDIRICQECTNTIAFLQSLTENP